VQNSSTADHTFYTQVNMTRTIEQILGIPTMNQSDLVASSMYTVFLPGAPKLTQSDLAPFSHVVNAVPLDQGYSGNDVSKANDSSAVKALRAAWMAKKTEIFAGKYHKPDAEDSDTVNHLDWYEATGFTRPYPGEKTVRAASDFNKAAPVKGDGDDD